MTIIMMSGIVLGAIIGIIFKDKAPVHNVLGDSENSMFVFGIIDDKKRKHKQPIIWEEKS